MPGCSLVIRAYNEAAHIGRLIEGLSRQTLHDLEVILVDSGSTDATVELAASAGAQVVHIPPAEFTFGRSLNLGLAAANCDLVAIASAHVYPVYPDWLERLLEPFSDPQVVLTYGKQRAPASSYFSEQQVYQRWYPEHSDSRQTHPFCNNANAAVRLSAWKNHPYDETLDRAGGPGLGQMGACRRAHALPMWPKPRLSISITRNSVVYTTATSARPWPSNGFIRRRISICMISPG